MKKPLKDPEYGVDSRYSSDEERKLDGNTLMKARSKRNKNLSDEQINQAKCLQSKLKNMTKSDTS